MQEIMKRLHWKCRRGMKEMDILFEHYLYEFFEKADDSHKKAFEKMCDMQDPIVADYLFERRKPGSTQVNDIIIIMRNFSINNANR